MKLFPLTPAARAGAVFAFLAMAVVGWKTAAPPPPQAVVRSEPVVTAPKPVRHHGQRNSGVPEIVRQRMASIRALEAPEDRMRATIDLAKTLPVSEFDSWMTSRWFSTGRGFDLSLFNKILKERWENEDPEGYLTWKLRNNPRQAAATLASWATTEPDRLATYLKNHPDKKLQREAFAAIAGKNPALALQWLREMPASSRMEFAKTNGHDIFGDIAKSSPGALAAALESLPDSLKLQAESALIAERLRTSFSDEFPKLLARPDGWKIFSASFYKVPGIGDKIFDQLGELPDTWKASLGQNPYSLINAASASKWLNADLEGLGFSTRNAKNIRMTALGNMTEQQPEEALKMLGTLGLEADQRKNIVGAVFRNLAGKPEKVEALLPLIPDEERQYVREILAPAVQSAPIQKIDQPTEWLEKISSHEGSPYQYLGMIREWSPEKMAELGNQFRALPGEQKMKVARTFANYGSSLGNELAGDAVRYLVSQPLDSGNQTRGHIEQASKLVTRWAKEDPAAAGTWVRTLPAGEARLWAQKNLAASWARYNPAEAENWANSLPAAEREEVRRFMKADPGR
ncbi:MAG: hypothetical protein V4733_05040 [Verrucomicrobiota bacterium]